MQKIRRSKNLILLKNRQIFCFPVGNIGRRNIFEVSPVKGAL